MIVVDSLTKVFDSGSVGEKIALDCVSLTIKDEDFVTIIGGNGAGKSTLLNAIAGVFPIEAGTVTIGEKNVTNMPEYSRATYMGRVFQDPRMGTTANMSIEENLAIAHRRGKKRSIFRWGITKGERELFHDRLTELGLGLENRMKTKIGLLSGGQRQAITLLMATFNHPEILLLDEHTAALDPKTASKVLEITEKIVTENKLSALMVTHNMKDALRYGNRIMMMHEGRCVVDIEGERKQSLKVNDLLDLFEKASGEDMMNDRMLLS